MKIFRKRKKTEPWCSRNVEVSFNKRIYRRCPKCERVQVVNPRLNNDRYYCYHDGLFVYQTQEDPVRYMAKNSPNASATEQVLVVERDTSK